MKYFNGSDQLAGIQPLDAKKAVELFGNVKFIKSDSFSVWVARDANGILRPVERMIAYKVNGTKHKCSDRCRTAKGNSCECECGGQFHGVDA